MLTEEQLKNLPYKKGGAWFTVFFAVMASINFGTVLAVMNTSTNVIVQVMNWCGDELSYKCDEADNKLTFLQPIVFLSAAIASTCGTYVLAYGRRTVIYLLNVLIIIGSIICCVAPSSGGGYVTLLVGRFVAGLGVGLITVVAPLYLAETSPVVIRGICGTMHQITLDIGLVLAVAIGLPITQPDTEDLKKPESFEAHYWRYMFLLPIIFSVVQLFLVAFIFNKEPAIYTIGNLNADDVLTAFENSVPQQKALGQLQINYDNETALIILNHYKAKRIDSLKKVGQIPSDVTIEGITAAPQDSATVLSTEVDSVDKDLSIGEILRHPIHSKVLWTGIIMTTIQQWTCVNVIVTKSNSLLEDTGMEVNLITIFSLCVNVANTISTLVMTLFIEKTGRKKLLIIGSILQLIFLAPAAICYMVNWGTDVDEDVMAWMATGSMIGFMISFAVALGPIVWVYVSEILTPTTANATMGYISMWNWFMTLVNVFVSAYVDGSVVFVCSFFVSVIGLLYFQTFIKETAGRSISPFYDVIEDKKDEETKAQN